MNNTKVLVYRNDILAPSECYIAEQIRACRRWQPLLVGQRRVIGGAALDHIEARILRKDENIFKKLYHDVCRRLGAAPITDVKMLRAEGGALLHAHFGPDALDIWPVVRRLRIPMVVTLHGYDINTKREWWEAGHGGKRYRNYPRALLRLAGHPCVHFLAVSEAVRTRAVDFGIPPSKIKVSYIGIDTDTFQPGGTPITRRKKSVIFVGRLVENKGVNYLLRAFASVHRRVAGSELIIIGDGPLRIQLEEEARVLNIPARFEGTLPSAAVRAQLGEARLLCLPSVTISNGESEGFGLVLLEAQSCGVPVLSSARGGAYEGILHGDTGFRFAERDVVDLSERICFLLENDAVLARMAENAAAHVRSTFDIRACSARLEEAYDAICAHSAPPRRDPLARVRKFAAHVSRVVRKPFSSANYWEERYASNGISGPGSYNHLAEFKAEIINAFVREQRIVTVIEFGCGDGNQLRYADYPSYVGFDISATAVERCRHIFRGDSRKSFFLLESYSRQQADVALSLDVIFHLVEDNVFDEYMTRLFSASHKFVIIYSSNTDENERHQSPHVRHRLFTAWVRRNRPDWRLWKHIPNRYPFDGDDQSTSFCDFFIYKRAPSDRGDGRVV